MPAHLAATADVSRVESPVTFKAYLMCAFASFGGIFFGYDIGYIGSVFAMREFSTLTRNIRPHSAANTSISPHLHWSPVSPRNT